MKAYGVVILAVLFFIHNSASQCGGGRKLSFVRWSGVTSERAAPVFVYSASGEEESLTGACLARCRELDDCAAVVVAYSKGNCLGVADTPEPQLKVDSDATFFKKICLQLSEECSSRWWAVESTPGYNLHAESSHLKVVSNATIKDCYDAVLAPDGDRTFRSAQWVGPEGVFDAEYIQASDSKVGSCLLNAEDKFTEPESYRVSNYYTFYIENQCRHDYLRKIDRCSYEEYYNQTLKHVDYTFNNYTKDECKRACEIEDHFICRGFTWIPAKDRAALRGVCDLHSEDLVTTGSWLLRRISGAAYYRRVMCLNISVECQGTELLVTYRPRGVFRGIMYVPGRGDRCSATPNNGVVKLSLPMYGDCDVNFAYGISNGPNGIINRTMAYVMVMIQNNPIIQTAGDRWVRVGCSPGARTPTHINATLAVKETGRSASSMEADRAAAAAGASAVYGASAAPLSMYVVRAGDGRGAGAVSLGEPLYLRVETTDEAEIEAYHLVASSRLGDSSVLLLDSKGCPTGQVDFPQFTRSYLGGTQRLSALFKAFRFPTSHVVRFALMIRFCENKCKQVNCGNRNRDRVARETNDTSYFLDNNIDSIPAAVTPDASFDRAQNSGVVAQGGARGCAVATDEAVALELEMVVDSKDIMSADTLVRADHRATTRIGT
ncbi:uncharacterized protein LOC115445400 isoform X2 [Manduca sexta]|uniref:uncharacterized protein LOC115445400 isoform X2 n=1 Tax=Manduca sexta TaxID=7130 RepID=UPI00188F0E26|nr:uncharacterized protein LOC115445400 isoform X2 [Manduca sexta]